MRPQYGSAPLSEHCTSWLLATPRAAMRASASVRAPTTRTRANFVAPSASRAICSASEAHTSVSASVNAWRSTGPARPPASTSTVSLVERAPSTFRQSNDSETAAASARWSAARSMAASVVTTASIVAMAGESIAAPFAIPPTVAAPIVATASFGFVSVVMMARAASAPPPLDTCAHSFGMPASIGAIGIGIPIRPVEQTRTSAGASPRPSAVNAHMRRGVGPARLTRRGVRVAGVEHDRGGAAVAEMRRAHLHRRGLREVRREHAGRNDGRAVLGRHDREIGCAGLLDPARQPARFEPARPQ